VHELLLLAANFNFIASPRYLGDITADVLFFFAHRGRAESAIGGWRSSWCCFRERSASTSKDLEYAAGMR